MILNPRQELFPSTFKGTMKSSIIKAVTQTKFETCVTAFIALDFKVRRKKCPDGIWDDFLVQRLFFDDSKEFYMSQFFLQSKSSLFTLLEKIFVPFLSSVDEIHMLQIYNAWLVTFHGGRYEKLEYPLLTFENRNQVGFR